MHKCPQEPCEDCWDEVRGVGLILVIFGLIVIWMVSGCSSFITADCKRGNDGNWICNERR